MSFLSIVGQQFIGRAGVEKKLEKEFQEDFERIKIGKLNINKIQIQIYNYQIKIFIKKINHILLGKLQFKHGK